MRHSIAVLAAGTLSLGATLAGVVASPQGDAA